MPDRRRTRQLLLFLGNVASGVVTVVVIFFGVVWAEDIRSFVPLLLILVAVPALATRGWRTELERRDRERDQATLVAWQAFRVLIAWEAIGIVLAETLMYFAYSAMAPVPHFHKTSTPIDLMVISAVVGLPLWFTWVRSRRILDLLWPTAEGARRSSQVPYLQLKL
jgi:hypothetical protein